MHFVLLILALAQEADIEKVISDLDHDDPDVREKATKDLAARGPAVIPRILALHRATDSPEIRSRAETVLLRYDFMALAQTRPEEPIRKTIEAVLLKDIEAHRATPGCRRAKENQPAVDASRLRIQWQSGSGHGQSLNIDQLVSRDGGGLTVRRIAYQGTTPYRPEVKKEGVRVEETRLSPGEAEALAGLLQTAAALREQCAIEKEKGRSWHSTGSFTMRFRVESAGAAVWIGAYTGYPGSLHEKEYIHGNAIDNMLRAAMAHRAWSRVRVLPEDRARALQWMTDHFADEGWWVKEHYLDMARFLGDGSYLPFLRGVAKDLQGNDGHSEKRRLKSAREAISRITGGKE